MSTSTFQSFELMKAKLTSGNRTFIFLVVYHPPSGQETTFLKDFAALIDSYMTMAGHLIIVSDFNMHWESPQKSCAVKLRDLLSPTGITQHMTTSTLASGHTLGLVMIRTSESVVTGVCTDACISDHMAMHFKVKTAKLQVYRKVNLLVATKR